jgi:hypothetical protein
MNERAGGAEDGLSSLGALTDWRRLEPLVDAMLDAPPDRQDAIARN